jgi:uncharacterized protein involved in outer membrane biogenesis
VLKKTLIGGLIAIAVLFAGTFFWARSVLTGENVRAALAAQVENAIGQPVSIGTISAGITPRVTMTLGEVKIGRPERILIGELHVGTGLRALLSRRIEHASLKLTGARIELPLPDFTIAASTEPPADAKPSAAPVELVSIDEIVLSNVQVVSGGRTLRGDIEVVPQGKGLLIRKIALGADQTTINVTGQITDFTGPVGELQVKAGALNMDQLLAFVNDFTTGAGMSGTAAAPAPGRASASPAPAGMNIALSLEAESATMNGLTLSKLNGKTHVAGDGLTLDPVSFGIFGGQYQGSLTLTPVKDTLRFRGSSTLSHIDVAAATAFGGSPGAISGRLSGRLDFAGSGTDAATVMKTVRGKARVDIVDGIVKNLGLINSVVVATSMRPGSLDQVASSAKSGPRDEPFSKLGATLEIANGSVSTNDLLFEAKDVILNAQGVVGLVASTVALKGKVQLSDALSQRAGRDLVRYTQEQGRVTLPATVTGLIEALSVRIEVGDMARRALQNAANEQKERVRQEATKALSKKLGGLFGR